MPLFTRDLANNELLDPEEILPNAFSTNITNMREAQLFSEYSPIHLSQIVIAEIHSMKNSAKQIFPTGVNL